MTLFWVIFDPGKVDIGLPEVEEGEEIPLRNNFAMFALATYEIFVAIVFLNLLVAVMNNAVQKIQDKRNLYWRFVRTGIMIDFFDSTSSIPSPFTLANMLWVVSFGIYRLVIKAGAKKKAKILDLDMATLAASKTCRGPTQQETNHRREHMESNSRFSNVSSRRRPRSQG